MRELVRAQHQDHADHSLQESGGSGVAPVAVLHARVIDEGVQDLSAARADGIPLQDQLLEADGQRIAEIQDQQQHDHRPHPRQGDVPDPAPFAAPSIAADSYSAGSMAFSAARKTMIPQPASFHTTWEVIRNKNVSGLVMTSTAPSPNSRVNWLSSPAPPRI